jgi:meso-butanediol dehydrogenase / (S,S)-butanediol dehydrogenase / diacetyl reductase
MANTTHARFEDRTVIVTGAASGIGARTAARFVGEGARVFGLDRDTNGLSAVAAELRAAGPGSIRTHSCDVTRSGEVNAAIAECVAAFGQVDVLVNAAGVGAFRPFEEIDDAEWNRVLSVNLTGPFFTMRAALPHLRRSRGTVVNVSSAAGLRGVAYGAAYAASKAGLLNLSRSLALEMAPEDVRVNCVCPGGVLTPLLAQFVPRDDYNRTLLAYNMPPKPGRLADPDDIAGIILFLASDAARTVNGAWLTADGGQLA